MPGSARAASKAGSDGDGMVCAAQGVGQAFRLCREGESFSLHSPLEFCLSGRGREDRRDAPQPGERERGPGHMRGHCCRTALGPPALSPPLKKHEEAMERGWFWKSRWRRLAMLLMVAICRQTSYHNPATTFACPEAANTRTT